jgi:hypothetical protein
VPHGADSACILADENCSDVNKATCDYAFLLRGVFKQNASCPPVIVEYTDAGNAQTDRLFAEKRNNPDYQRYPVEVCQAVIEKNPNIAAVRFSRGTRIALPKSLVAGRAPQTIAMLGDTGCRDNRDQLCSTEWPFETVSGRIAIEAKPELVIHVGDYVYGGGDHWQAWRYKFFKPGKRMLGAAPIVPVRGNHEACSDDAPNGWLLFFDYPPGGGVDFCQNNKGGHTVATYALDLGDKLRLIVADSSNAYFDKKVKNFMGLDGCDTKIEDKEIFIRNCEHLVNEFINIRSLSQKIESSSRQNWLLTHVPMMAVEKAKEKDKQNKITKKTAMMIVAWLASAKNKTEGQPAPNTIISGDLHLYQSVKGQIGGTSPQLHQYTTGMGGVVLDRDTISEGGIVSTKGLPVAEKWDIETKHEHGYITAKRIKGNYVFKPHTFPANKLPVGRTAIRTSNPVP